MVGINNDRGCCCCGLFLLPAEYADDDIEPEPETDPEVTDFTLDQVCSKECNLFINGCVGVLLINDDDADEFLLLFVRFPVES